MSSCAKLLMCGGLCSYNKNFNNNIESNDCCIRQEIYEGVFILLRLPDHLGYIQMKHMQKLYEGVFHCVLQITLSNTKVIIRNGFAYPTTNKKYTPFFSRMI